MMRINLIGDYHAGNRCIARRDVRQELTAERVEELVAKGNERERAYRERARDASRLRPEQYELRSDSQAPGREALPVTPEYLRMALQEGVELERDLRRDLRNTVPRDRHYLPSLFRR